MKKPFTAAMLFSLCVLASTAMAENYFWSDSSDMPVRDGSGNCVHALYHGRSFAECGGMMAMPAKEVDSDGDGIPDSRDRCPGTTAGSMVDSQGCVMVTDSDGDGVPDNRDSCPGTAAGSRVDARGCPMVADSDGDGVPDDRDLCGNSPMGAAVNASGCTEKLVVQNLQFASNKAELQAGSRAQLAEIVAKIRNNPAISGMTITGYTDDRGAASYNQYLSEQRAQAIRTYFIEQGIDGATIRAVGMGEAKPIADNATAEGRAQNRRVEIDFQMK